VVGREVSGTMPDFIQVMTTTGTKEEAQKIARAVVEKRLAGCAQVLGPIESTYWWENQVQTAKEWLCLIKSREDLYSSLEHAIQEVHPYDVPEILAIPVVEGSKAYLDWLERELR
jgi:periplasmic divalent cation tolerance protein